MKKVIRLTENDLHRIVRNSVSRILRETSLDEYEKGDEWMGQVFRDNENERTTDFNYEEWWRRKEDPMFRGERRINQKNKKR